MFGIQVFIKIILTEARLSRNRDSFFLCLGIGQLFDGYLPAVAPDPLQVIEQPILTVKDVDDQIAEIKEHPVCVLVSFRVLRDKPGLAERFRDMIGHRLDLVAVFA